MGELNYSAQQLLPKYESDKIYSYLEYQQVQEVMIPLTEIVVCMVQIILLRFCLVRDLVDNGQRATTSFGLLCRMIF